MNLLTKCISKITQEIIKHNYSEVLTFMFDFGYKISNSDILELVLKGDTNIINILKEYNLLNEIRDDIRAMTEIVENKKLLELL